MAPRTTPRTAREKGGWGVSSVQQDSFKKSKNVMDVSLTLTLILRCDVQLLDFLADSSHQTHGLRSSIWFPSLQWSAGVPCLDKAMLMRDPQAGGSVSCMLCIYFCGCPKAGLHPTPSKGHFKV